MIKSNKKADLTALGKIAKAARVDKKVLIELYEQHKEEGAVTIPNEAFEPVGYLAHNIGVIEVSAADLSLSFFFDIKKFKKSTIFEQYTNLDSLYPDESNALIFGITGITYFIIYRIEKDVLFVGNGVRLENYIIQTLDEYLKHMGVATDTPSEE